MPYLKCVRILFPRHSWSITPPGPLLVFGSSCRTNGNYVKQTIQLLPLRSFRITSFPLLAYPEIAPAQKLYSCCFGRLQTFGIFVANVCYTWYPISIGFLPILQVFVGFGTFHSFVYGRPSFVVTFQHCNLLQHLCLFWKFGQWCLFSLPPFLSGGGVLP